MLFRLRFLALVPLALATAFALEGGDASASDRMVFISTSPVPAVEHAPLRACTTSWTEVSPCTGSVSASTSQTGLTRTFTIRNKQLFSRTFGLSCSRSGSVSSCSVAGSTTIGSNTTKNVTVTYATGSVAGTGTLQLNVNEDDNVSASATVTTTVPPLTYTVSVTPDAQAVSAAANAINSQTFRVTNSGNTGATYTLALTCPAGFTNCSAPASQVVAAGSYADVIVSYQPGGSGSTGTVTLTASYSTASDMGSVVATVPSPLSPVVSVEPHNGFNRAAGRCVNSCFDVIASYSTPSYTSMDTPRSVTLVYSSAQAFPTGTIQVNASDKSARPAQVMSLSLQRPDGSFVSFANGVPELFFSTSDSATKRLAGQFDATGLTTGVYDYTAVVKSYWTTGLDAGTVTQAVAPVKVLILNERASAYGAGWTVAGLQRLHFSNAQTIAATRGEGSIAAFKKESGLWTAPAGDFGRLEEVSSNGINAGYKLRAPDGIVDSFSTAGYLRTTRDRFGNTTTYTYNAADQVISIQDPAGKEITLGYVDGRLSSITDPAGRVSRVTIDAATGNLARIDDPTGATAFLGVYDDSKRMLQRTDRGGGTWVYVYDHASKLNADSTPPVRVDAVTKRLATRYRSLESAVLVDPASGAGLSLTTPASQRLSDSVRLAVFPVTGDSARFSVDAFGAALRIDHPSVQTTTVLTRNGASQAVKTLTTAKGKIVQLDSSVWSGPRLTKYMNVLSGLQVSHEYDTTYNIATLVSGNTQQVTHFLNAGKSLIDSTRVGSATSDSTIRYWYDARGRTIKTRDQMRDSTVTVYDPSGYQNTLSTMRGTRTTQLRYDTHGRLMATVSPSGDSVWLSLDSLNRPRSAHGEDGAAASYAYDARGLRSTTDAKGQTYTYARNALGWLDTLTNANTTDPLANRQEVWEYNASGRATAHINRRGQRTSYTYDGQGRVRTQTLADGRQTTFVYDTAGMWSAASNGESVDTLWADTTHRLAKQITVRDGTRHVLTETTDALGLVRSRVLTQGDDPAALFAVSYGYNSKRKLDTLLVRGKQTRFTYNADGLLKQLWLPTGDTLSFDLTGGHRPYTMKFKRAALNTAFGASYALDARDRLKKISNAAQDTSSLYDYSRLGELTQFRRYRYMSQQVCEPDPFYMDGMRCTTTGDSALVASRTLAYDLVGNPSDLGAVVVPGNRLTRYNGYTLEYDFDGNLIRKYLTSNSSVFDQRLWWNSAGQLDSVQTTRSGTTASTSFGYDGWGRRVRKSTASQTLRYLYDGAHVLAELDAATGARLRLYSYYPGVDNPHSVTVGEATYYYLTSIGAAHVIGLIDSTGAIKNRYRYSPFGEHEQKVEEVTNPLQFTAREYDPETGLYFVRARYYDPALGRFISEDPTGQASGQNQYAYVGNDPVNQSDPSGLSPERMYHGGGCYPVPKTDGSCGSRGGGGSRGVTTLGYAGNGGKSWAEWEAIATTLANILREREQQRRWEAAQSLVAIANDGLEELSATASAAPQQEKPPAPWEPVFTLVGSRARPEYTAIGIGITLDPIIAANAKLADKPGVAAFLLMQRDLPTPGQLTPSYTGTLFFSGEAWGVTYKPRALGPVIFGIVRASPRRGR